MPEYKVEDLGQVFTPDNIVNQMIDMIKFGGRILEPSCGDGAFSKPLIDKFSDVVSIEFDSEHCPHWALNMDFFDYPVTEKFSTIIGNPPYVSGKKILKSTLDKIDSQLITHGKSNLYLYFIEKSIHHLEEGGEIIFITPREFIKNTSSA
jgi:adenine-specific DNA-methyltransferase